jgi:hypothetical protein
MPVLLSETSCAFLRAKRSTSFGFGDRFKSISVDRKPTPGLYKNEVSDFKKKGAGRSFGVSRSCFDKVFINKVILPLESNVPGPGAYQSSNTRNPTQITFGSRTKCLDTVTLNLKDNIPGPGSYSTLNTLTKTGSHYLSTIK